ncbi:hypothetical protein [Bradyrhizobium sp. G127]|uniref:hypothetical protein n=1 Tax=Bradyrhizobium sp. G127 TaxID=2904800 RepID=UPI001BC254BC|nr:hypothetical protein [Bradyrhizobium sp. G127]MBS4004960.1 hypothetical protein [Afipia sp.]MCF2521642.1 hypothetical protein [Bradyrhizobium sp. G127]
MAEVIIAAFFGAVQTSKPVCGGLSTLAGGRESVNWATPNRFRRVHQLAIDHETPMPSAVCDLSQSQELSRQVEEGHLIVSSRKTPVAG